MGILTDLSDMFPDTITCQPGTLDAFGTFTASGSAVTPSCYIEGEIRLVRDLNGQEVVSTLQVIVADTQGLTVDGYRYTLPARFSPNSNLKAIGVERVSDEDGAHHERLLFP